MTDLSIIANDVIDLYKRGIPGSMDAGIPRRLAEAVLALEAERDHCKGDLSSAVEVLRYIGNKVEGADTTLERSELADMANEVVAKVSGD